MIVDAFQSYREPLEIDLAAAAEIAVFSITCPGVDLNVRIGFVRRSCPGRPAPVDLACARQSVKCRSNQSAAWIVDFGCTSL